MLTHRDNDAPAEPLPAVGRPNARHTQLDELAAGNRVATLICINAAYLQHAAVCLTSLLANNPDLFFDIVIVSRPDEEFNEEKLRRSLAHFSNHCLSFRTFLAPAEAFLKLNPRAHYTLDIWTRLWVEEFFADDVDRVLYLDADIVIVGSIAPLWHTDLGDNLVGAVDIPGAQVGVLRLGLKAEEGYFNSGVLLINLKQWRKVRALDALIGYVNEHPERMVYTPDQDALNACLHDRKTRLDPQWNAVWTFFQQTDPVPLPHADLEAVRREARILHFNNHPKPWSYFCAHPRKAEYEKYLRMTEWRDFVPPDRTPMNRLRKWAAAILPTSLKALLRKLQPLESGLKNQQRLNILTNPPDIATSVKGETEFSTTVRTHRVAVMICTDANYLQHSAVCLASLLTNNRDLFFDIVVIKRPSEHLAEDKLRRTLGQFPNHSLIFRTFTPPSNGLLHLNPNAHYTLDSWNRLWVEEFFRNDVDRVLYLDGDVVVVGSIAPLWHADLEGHLIGAVDIPGAQVGVLRLGLGAEDGYFNAGVLLINLREWRKARVLDTLVKYIREHPEQMVYTLDQDALNACLYDRKKRLDPIWNAVWTFYQEIEPVPISRTELESVRSQAHIIHFNNQPKPWSYFCVHPRRAEYQKYLSMTEWRNFVPADRTPLNRLRKLAAAVLPNSQKAWLRRLDRRFR